MTTRASIEKRIYNELLKSETKQVLQHEFLPEKLGVKNLATYFKGANEEQAKERMFLAFHEAYHHAGQKGYDIASVRITNASAWHLTKGAMVFVADRVETKDEFEMRCRHEAQMLAAKEWRPIYEKRRAQQALKNAQAELDRLEGK